MADQPAVDFTDPSDDPRLAVRRVTDRCFHAVEEVVPGEGYIVDGFLIPLDEVAEVRHDPPPRCATTARRV